MEILDCSNLIRICKDRDRVLYHLGLKTESVKEFALFYDKCLSLEVFRLVNEFNINKQKDSAEDIKIFKGGRHENN